MKKIDNLLMRIINFIPLFLLKKYNIKPFVWMHVCLNVYLVTELLRNIQLQASGESRIFFSLMACFVTVLFIGMIRTYQKLFEKSIKRDSKKNEYITAIIRIVFLFFVLLYIPTILQIDIKQLFSDSQSRVIVLGFINDISFLLLLYLFSFDYVAKTE